MPTLNEAEIFQSAAALLAALRLLTLGLARRQKGLFSFLCTTSAVCFTLSFLPPASPNYFWIFLSGTLITWLVSIRAVREMFTLSLSEYPGIRTAAGWSLYASLTFSLLISAGLTFSHWQRGPHGTVSLYYVQVVDRVIGLALSVVVAGMMLFLSRYPLHLSRNTNISCFFFSAVFLAQAGIDLVDTFDTKLYSLSFDTVEVLICSGLFVGWTLLLRSEAEAPSRRVSFEDPRESELLRQLDAMNRLLSRVERR